MNQLALCLESNNPPSARGSGRDVARFPGRKAEPPRARRDDPATSKAAAQKVERFASGHFAKILDAMRPFTSCTYREIAAEAGLEPVAVARRLRELETAGKIARAGDAGGFTLWKLAP